MSETLEELSKEVAFLIQIATDLVKKMVQQNKDYADIATGEVETKVGRKGRLLLGLVGSAEIETTFGSQSLSGLGFLYQPFSEYHQKRRARKLYNAMPASPLELFELLVDFAVDLVFALQNVLPPLLQNEYKINRINFLRYVAAMVACHIKGEKDMTKLEFVDKRFLLRSLFYPETYGNTKNFFVNKEWTTLNITDEKKLECRAIFEDCGIYYEGKFWDSIKNGKSEQILYRLDTLVDSDELVKERYVLRPNPTVQCKFLGDDTKQLIQIAVRRALECEFKSVKEVIQDLTVQMKEGFNTLAEQIRELSEGLASNWTEPSMSRPGNVRIEKRIGSGKFADVFKASYGYSIKQTFALKEIFLSRFIEQNLKGYNQQGRQKPKEYLIRFLRELKMMESLRMAKDDLKSHIVQLEAFWLEGQGSLRGKIEDFMSYERSLDDIPEDSKEIISGAANIKLCMLMEYCETNLKDWIAGHDVSVRKEFARSFICQIAKGLLALHSLNIFHRDLKCTDILLVSIGKKGWIAKLGDYGHAREYLRSTEVPTNFSYEDFNPFASPEVYAQQKYNQTTDIYSLGVIAIHLLLDIGNMEDSVKEDRFEKLRCRPLKGCPFNTRSVFFEIMKTEKVLDSDIEIIRIMISYDAQARPDISEIIKHFRV